MAKALLLDEMLSPAIAESLRGRGYDVTAIAEDTRLIGLGDADVLEAAKAARRTLVTLNVRDFVLLDHAYRAVRRSHGGVLLVSARTFPPNRRFTGALVTSLARVLDSDRALDDVVLYLAR